MSWPPASTGKTRQPRLRPRFGRGCAQDQFKTKLVDLHGPWRTRTEAELAVLEYINWFNTARLHGELDQVPPREYEEVHYRSKPAPTPVTVMHT